MMYAWVLTKSYEAPGGEILPVAWSYGYNHDSMGYEANGWGLTWLTLDAQQLTFLRAGVDPNVQVLGRERSKVTPLLMETYKDKLDPAGVYGTVGDVLEQLGEVDPRFLLERDPRLF